MTWNGNVTRLIGRIKQADRLLHACEYAKTNLLVQLRDLLDGVGEFGACLVSPDGLGFTEGYAGRAANLVAAMDRVEDPVIWDAVGGSGVIKLKDIDNTREFNSVLRSLRRLITQSDGFVNPQQLTALLRELAPNSGLRAAEQREVRGYKAPYEAAQEIAVALYNLCLENDIDTTQTVTARQWHLAGIVDDTASHARVEDTASRARERRDHGIHV